MCVLYVRNPSKIHLIYSIFSPISYLNHQINVVIWLRNQNEKMKCCGKKENKCESAEKCMSTDGRGGKKENNNDENIMVSISLCVDLMVFDVHVWLWCSINVIKLQQKTMAVDGKKAKAVDGGGSLIISSIFTLLNCTKSAKPNACNSLTLSMRAERKIESDQKEAAGIEF